MSHSQPDLFGDDQPGLFGSAPAPAAYRVKPAHVINRFIDFDAQLRVAERWPWEAWRRGEIRARTWPYLLAKLREIGCEAEAAHWQQVMAAHAERLDALTPPEPDDPET